MLMGSATFLCGFPWPYLPGRDPAGPWPSSCCRTHTYCCQCLEHEIGNTHTYLRGGSLHTPAKDPLDELENDISDIMMYSVSYFQQSASAIRPRISISISISISIRLGQARLLSSYIIAERFLRQLFFPFANLLTRSDTNDAPHLPGFNFQQRPFQRCASALMEFSSSLHEGKLTFLLCPRTNSSQE
jgi:hypothetical protein